MLQSAGAGLWKPKERLKAAGVEARVRRRHDHEYLGLQQRYSTAMSLCKQAGGQHSSNPSHLAIIN